MDASSLRSGVSYSTLLWALAFGAPQPAAAAPQETAIYDFQGAPGDGQNPLNALVIDEAGALYGTTGAGGSERCTLTESGKPRSVIGCGTVFRLTPPAAGKTDWSDTILYSFPATNISQKKEPFGAHTAIPGALTYDGAVRGEPYDGVSPLYGSASSGGAFGNGYVFELLPPAQGKTGWVETTLHDFGSSSADGAHPNALLMSRRGTLYGTTLTGGSAKCSSFNPCGAVFALTPPAKGKTQWTETVIYQLPGPPIGTVPTGGLLIDKTNRLYGTAQATLEPGTGSSCFNSFTSYVGCATVFRLTPPAKKTTVWSETWRFSFGAGTHSLGVLTHFGAISGRPYDGASPLYGAECPGGAVTFCGGVVFELVPPAKGTTGGSATALLSFTGANGSGPSSLVGTAGKLYGTTSGGGSENAGVGYRLAPPTKGNVEWTETILHNFGAAADGASPIGGLVTNRSGALFGATVGGGTKGLGTIYKLTP